MKLESDTLTAIERFKKVIHHEEPDRLPIFLMGIPEYSQCYIELMEEEEDLLDEFTEDDENVLLTPFGDYTIRYFFGAEVEPRSVNVKLDFKKKILDENNKIIGDFDQSVKNEVIDKARKTINKTKKSPGILLKTVDYNGRIEGYTILENGREYTWYIGPYLTKEEDIINWFDTYGWENEKKVIPIEESLFKQAEIEFGDKLVFIPQISGHQLYESLWPMMGQGRFGYFCRKRPELIHRLINAKKEAQLKIIEEIKKVKPLAVFGGDDLGQKGRSLISPAMFRKFFKEPYKEIFQKIHDMGAIAFNHMCGNATDLLDDLIEAGLDGWQSLEPDSLIDHAALKKKYGDRFLFVGGLNQSYMTRPGVGPKEVEEHVKAQIKKMAKGGGYIAGPAHDYLNVPLKNALALRNAVYKWGRYPINF
ncbi:MAG: uroporphyrinogen decarboxylase family protein [Promethearchaeota archaeon]